MKIPVTKPVFGPEEIQMTRPRMPQKANILITGGTGFIGKNLVEQTKNDFDFLCLTREVQDLSKPLHFKVPRPDIVIQLAQANTREPEEMFDINIKSTFNLLEYARKNRVKKFIYASTGSVYGFGNKKFKESDKLNPLDFYGVSKIAAEEICWQYRDCFDINILRIFAPYGENQQSSRLIPSLVHKIKTGEPVTLHTATGNPRLNPIYINDVVEVIRRSIGHPGSYRLNLAGEKPFSILEIAELIGEMTHQKPVYKIVQNPEVRDLTADTMLMKTLLRFSPKTSLEEGLRKLCHNFVVQLKI